MKLAVIGSGGREHAICYKLKQSSKLDHVGVFGKSVLDVALIAKSLIKKDLYD